MPGGAEALFHARGSIEELAASGVMGPLAVADVDMVKSFPSVEWQSVLEVYDAELPSMAAWERWATEQPVSATFPSGGQTVIDRGAGQGEPDGRLNASVPLGRAVDVGKRRPHSPLASEIVDFWFLGDDQFFTRHW